MELSQNARDDLRKVLVNDIGPKATSDMTEEDLDHIGSLLLTVLAESLKMKANEAIRTQKK